MALEVGSLQSNITLDLKDFNESIQQLKHIVGELGTVMSNALGKGFSQGYSTMLKQLSELREQIKQLQAEAIALSASLSKQQRVEGFTQVQQVTSRLKENITSLTQDINIFSAAVDQPKAEVFSSLIVQGDEVLSIFSSIEKSTASMTNNFQQLSTVNPFTAMQADAARLADAFSKVDAAIQKIGAISTIGGIDVLQIMYQYAFDTRDAIRALGQEIFGLSDSFDAIMHVRDTFIELGTTTRRVITTVQALKKEIEGLAATEGFRDVLDFSSMTLQMQEFKKTINETLTTITGMSASLQQASEGMFAGINQQTQRVASSLRSAAIQMGQFADLAVQAQSAAGGIPSKTDATSRSATRAASSIKSVTKNTQDASAAAKELSNDFKASDKNVKTLQKSTKGFSKDLTRMVSGILISQAFYKVLGILKDMVAASYDFVMNMESAQIAFKYLLGTAEQAQGFLGAIQQYASISPLNVEDITSAARSLMAMGFAAESTIPTISILTDTAAVFSNNASEMSEMIDRISLAFGQMKAAGKLTGQELRQLYNAGIPVYKILKEQLGLSDTQVRNISKLGVDVNTAIAALLKGLAEEYSGAAREMAETIPALLKRAIDSIGQIAYTVTAIPFKYIKAGLQSIVDVLGKLATITKAYGPGGLFEALVPEDMQNPLRNLIGMLGELWKVVYVLAKTVGESLVQGFAFAIKVITTILPPITVLINAFVQIARWVLVNIPFVKTLFGLLGNYGIILALVFAFRKLYTIMLMPVVSFVVGQFKNLFSVFAKLFTLMLAHPWTIALAAIVAILAVVIFSSETARAKVTQLFETIQGYTKKLSDAMGLGWDPAEILQPKFDEETFNVNQYTDALINVSDAYDGISDSASDAADEIDQSFNQTFDEVYSVNPNEGAFAGFSALSDLDFSDLVGQLADMNGIMDDMDWTGAFDVDWGNLSDGIKSFGDYLEDLGLKLPDWDLSTWGAKFWEMLGKVWEEAPEWIFAAVGAAIAGILAAILGLPAIAIAIGALVGWLYGILWKYLEEKFGVTSFQGLGNLIIAGLIGVFTALLGAGTGWALVAAAIALVVQSLVSIFIAKVAEAFGKSEQDMERAGIGQIIGAALGAIIGGVLFGPAGAIIGAAIGGLAGGLLGLFIKDIGDAFYTLGMKIGEWEMDLAKQVAGTHISWAQFVTSSETSLGRVNLALGNFLATTTTGFLNWRKTNLEGFTTWWTTTSSGFAEWQVNTMSSFVKWNIDTLKEFSVWWVDTKQGFSTWWTDTKKGFSDWFDTSLAGLDNWGNMSIGEFASWTKETLRSFKDWATEASGTFGTWITDSVGGFANWQTRAMETFTGWISDSLSGIVNWHKESLGSFIEWQSSSLKSFTDWASSVSKAFVDFTSTSMIETVNWAKNTGQTQADWIATSTKSFVQWNKDIVSNVGSWVKDTTSSFSSWKREQISNINDFVSATKQQFKTWVSEVKLSIKNWASDTKSSIVDWVKSVIEAFKEWWQGVIDGFKNLWSNIIQGVKDWGANLVKTVSEAITKAINKIKEFFSFSSKASSEASSIAGGLGENEEVSYNLKANPIGSLPDVSVPGGLGELGSMMTLPTNFASRTPFSGTGMRETSRRSIGGPFGTIGTSIAGAQADNEALITSLVDRFTQAIVDNLTPETVEGGTETGMSTMYVGTLIADDRGLRELYRKFRIINEQDKARGITSGGEILG